MSPLGWLRRRRTLRNNLIFLILVAIVILLLNTSDTSTIIDLQTLTSNSSSRLYFETPESVQQLSVSQGRIKLKSVVRSGADYEGSEEGYNEAFLDSLPILRSDIIDFSPEICSSNRYQSSDLTISVVINYHNELLSLLLRTIYSVLSAIPPQNLRELILIDDASNLTTHPALLEVEPLVSLFAVPVRFIRFARNRGLIFSRRFGCEEAAGDLVLVLDSHCEVREGFLEPLLHVLENKRNVVVAPVFDFWDTFENKFWSYDGSGLGFDRYMTWITIKAPEDGSNFPTPAIMGGAFLVHKSFLRKVDYFGRCMEGWGYENIELSLKTWRCGGEVIYVPCSRVLHYAAKRSPMNHGDRVKAEHYLFNAGIVVKSLLTSEDYEDFAAANGVKIYLDKCESTIKHNQEVMRLNGCSNSFEWVRQKLMPMVESYNSETLLADTLQYNDKCLGISLSNDNAIILRDCREFTYSRQRFRLTKWGELRILDRRCLDWGYKYDIKVLGCHNQGGAQITRYDPVSGYVSNDAKDTCIVMFADDNSFGKAACARTVEDGRSYSVPRFTFKNIYDLTSLLAH